MKRSIFCMMLITLFCCNLIAHENNYKNGEVQLAQRYLYAMKEFILLFTYHRWFMNFDTIYKERVVCKHCQYPVSFFQMFGYFAGNGNEAVVSELKRLACLDSAQELNKFIISLQKDYQQKCFKCDDASGWIVVD